MATLVLTDASVVFNGNDISDHVRKVTLNYGANALDDTAMGATTESRKGGLKKWSADVELNNDFTGSSIDAILFPLVGSTATLTIKPTSSAVSATNPRFFGTALLTEYPPLGNGVGELALTTAKFENAGALTRATT